MYQICVTFKNLWVSLHTPLEGDANIKHYIWNNEVSVRTSNPCEPKVQTLDCSKHQVSDKFYNF